MSPERNLLKVTAENNINITSEKINRFKLFFGKYFAAFTVTMFIIGIYLVFELFTLYYLLGGYTCTILPGFLHNAPTVHPKHNGCAFPYQFNL